MSNNLLLCITVHGATPIGTEIETRLEKNSGITMHISTKIPQLFVKSIEPNALETLMVFYFPKRIYDITNNNFWWNGQFTGNILI